MSAVVALANPRRIKASHRRRRRIASDHLLYILNNPLAATDPTGYLIGCGPNYAGCGGGGILGEFPGGGSSCRGFLCNFALGGKGNGAKSADSATPEKRDQSAGKGGSGALSRLGQLFAPQIMANAASGKAGSFGDHLANGGAFIVNSMLDSAELGVPGLAAANAQFGLQIPRLPYSDAGRATPAVLEGALFSRRRVKGYKLHHLEEKSQMPAARLHGRLEVSFLIQRRLRASVLLMEEQKRLPQRCGRLLLGVGHRRRQAVRTRFFTGSELTENLFLD